MIAKKNIHVIAEIGVNHNGDINLCKKLIDVAHMAGCDYVKFQKRNPALCVPEKQKGVMKDTPWGKMTYLHYKYTYNMDTPSHLYTSPSPPERG